MQDVPLRLVTRFCLLSTLLLTLAAPSWSELLFEEFEGTVPPAGWSAFHTGHGDFDWSRSTRLDLNWGYSAFSDAADLSPGEISERWLVTPRVVPAGDDVQFTCYLRTQYPTVTGNSTLLLLISPASTDPADFTDTLDVLIPGPAGDFQGVFQYFSFDLRDYADIPIYIALLHSDDDIGDNRIYADSVSGPHLYHPPSPPENPFPPNGSPDNPVTTGLSWDLDTDTETVDVYLSHIESEVTAREDHAKVIDNLFAEDYTPESYLVGDRTYYWRVVTRNAHGEEVGPVWSFQTAAGQLKGSYGTGSANDIFPDLSEAVSYLQTNGIDGPTTVQIAPGIYNIELTMPPVAGTADDAQIVFERADSLAAVSFRNTSGGSGSVVTFAGADHIQLQGIDIDGAIGGVNNCIRLESGSHHIVISDGDLKGPGTALSTNRVIELDGSNIDSNRFESLQIRGGVEGIYMNAEEGVSTGNVITGCRIDSVRRAVYLRRQDRCFVTGNEISCNAGEQFETVGVYVATTLAGDTISISGNYIFDLSTSLIRTVGIRAIPDNAQAVVRIYNNFIYNFRNTGSSQVRAIYVSSGDCRLYSNSIHVNDVEATGTVYGVYISCGSSAGKTRAFNNIIANTEQTNTSYGVYVLLSTADLISDYNIFHGTGSSYTLGRFGSNYPTLPEWTAGTSLDAHSLTGDPGFTSETDLHLISTNGLAHLNGMVIPTIASDIDGEPRLSPPDRGADEYVYDAPARDFAVLDFIDLQPTYPLQSTVPVTFVIQNRGSVSHTNVPVRLFLDDVQQTESAVSMQALETDTMTMDWDTPANGSSGVLRIQTYLSNDSLPENDSLSVDVQLIAPPLSGLYTISPWGDYPDITAAVEDLELRGVGDGVSFEAFGPLYTDNITITAVSGTSSGSTVCFFKTQTTETPVVITVDAGDAALHLNGADYITFDGIDFLTGPGLSGVLLSSGADHNQILNSVIKGASFNLTTACGIQTSGGGNDNNLFQNVTIDSVYCGFRIHGTPSLSDSGNIIEECRIPSSRIAVSTEWQKAAVISGNTISTGFDNAASSCRGIRLGSQPLNQTIIADGNILTGGRAAADMIAIDCDIEDGRASIRNHFICDWNVTGMDPLTAIRINSGTADVVFNSIRLNDVQTTGCVTGIRVLSGADTANVLNNIIVIGEQTDSACCIIQNGGVLNADYNVFYSSTVNPLFFIGRSLSEINHSTLTDWQAETGLDSNSQYANPGFVSASDLHIQNGSRIPSGAGIEFSAVQEDVDHEPRAPIPDIGADEYVFSLVAHDAAVSWTEMPTGIYPSDQMFSVDIRVDNSGALPEMRIPVKLYCDEILQDEIEIGLNPGEADTVTLEWTSPQIGLASVTLKAQCYLANDGAAFNDSVFVSVIIAGPPLTGGLDLGGGNHDFGSFTEAVQSLEYRGVSGPVTVNVYPGLYSETLRLHPVPGASAVNTILFKGTDSTNAPVLYGNSGDDLLQLYGAQFIQFDGLDLEVAGDVPDVVRFTAGACHNTLMNCELRGADSSQVEYHGVLVDSGGNNYNRLENLTVNGVYEGIALEGGSPGEEQSFGNTVSKCTIHHARCGIIVENQVDCEIVDNDIIPGSDSDVAGPCYGIFVRSLGNGGGVRIHGNLIHGFADNSGSQTNRAVGIYSAPAAGASVLAYNNFIYGFSGVSDLKINGIYLSSGTSQILYNSILIDEVPSGNTIAGIYVSSGTEHTLQNNIISSNEMDAASYGIYIAGGMIESDYNDLWGSSPSFSAGRVGTTVYSTLDLWQQLGFDGHSISADPGYISSSDLHIRPESGTVNGKGTLSEDVATDIDNQDRRNPPDIGADEYVAAVQGLTIVPSEGSIVLRWLSSVDAESYRIYAAESVDIEITPDYLLDTVADTSYVDPSPYSDSGLKFYLIVVDAEQP